MYMLTTYDIGCLCHISDTKWQPNIYCMRMYYLCVMYVWQIVLGAKFWWLLLLFWPDRDNIPSVSISLSLCLCLASLSSSPKSVTNLRHFLFAFGVCLKSEPKRKPTAFFFSFFWLEKKVNKMLEASCPANVQKALGAFLQLRRK